LTPDATLIAQLTPYEPWLLLGGVVVLFLLLRLTRKGLRKRVDMLGYHFLYEKGLLIWFWLNAPGVILHELSHAIAVLLFSPFGFRITSITFFGIKPMAVRGPNGRVVKSGRQSLQLGEVQYIRPSGKIMSYIGDGISGTAPLLGGVAMLTLLYWIATGYNLWDVSFYANHHLQLLRPGWPWWTLTFAPYLILTVTSELWPSRQDWHGARWFVVGLLFFIALGLIAIWYFKVFITALHLAALIASRVDLALVILLVLDLAFLLIAELIIQMIRR
jgi:hypothetical protein